MLGLGYYVWDKRCPSGKRCIPPIYGRFNTYIKVPENSPRVNGGDQAEAVSAPWKAGIPRGNDVCIKYGFRGNKKDAAPLKQRIPPKQDYRHHRQRSSSETLRKSNVDCSSCNPPTHSSPSSYTSKSFTGYNGLGGGKQFHNVMWDPKIARGPTLVPFDEAQRAKWKRQVEAECSTQLRKQIRRRRKKMKESEYLDARSNPMRQLVYPTVKLKKEPLTKSSYDLFLTEQCEPVTKMNAGQLTDNISCRVSSCKKSFSYGIPAGVQTEKDTSNNREETEQWVCSTMMDKIPQQAILELQEEAELEAVTGEQKRYELVFLYTKWQEMKERQWMEWNRAWNEIRMREILDQDAYLQEQQERVVLIGFCKNAISSCFQRTFEGMKQDGFINEQGVPYEELKEINECLDYQSETEKKLEWKELLARKVVDSTLINAVVQRFSAHMFDEYGRPHGAWLGKKGRRSSIEYDLELRKYLEGRWLKRREFNSKHVSLNGLFSETSLLNIFDVYKDSKKEIHKNVIPAARVKDDASVLIENVISKQRLGRRTIAHSGPQNKNDKDKEHEHRTSTESDDVSMLYKRRTSWSMLELHDENLHRQQQSTVSSLGSFEAGSRLVFDAKLARGGDGTIGKSTDGGNDATFREEREKVDSDKLEKPADGESEIWKNKPLLARTHPGRRKPSQAPHTRFQ